MIGVGHAAAQQRRGLHDLRGLSGMIANKGQIAPQTWR